MYLKDEWQAYSIDALQQGINFQNSFLEHLDANPDIFETFSTHDIAKTLRGLQRIIPDEQRILLPLYDAYDPFSNHEFRVWDLEKRIELMYAIESDPKLALLTDRLLRLERYNELHAQIFSFEPDTLETVSEPPAFFTKTGDRILSEEPDTYPVADRIEVLSCGRHDVETKAIILNTHVPEDPSKTPPTFHRSETEAAALVLHEGRHTMMDQLGRKAHVLPHQEFRDVVTILFTNGFGVYYLKGADERNRLNPCEKDAYEFQADMQAFLGAAPHERKSFITKIIERRDHHLSMIIPCSQTYPQTYPQHVPGIAA